ncbi:MAG: DUF177 domain-containing protein [Mariprofundus sp.]|nr:DUF177 domain-containing protein [Mariprofundus sp.]
MQRHWLVTLQNLAVTGRQWDTAVPLSLLADKELGSVRALCDLVSDMHWRAALERSGSVYRLCGQWQGLIKRQCSRCNIVFDWQADGSSEWTFQLGEEVAHEESGAACEYVAFPGEINLIDLLREDVWLAWKADVICSDSCLGLCQGCGVNLNIDLCQCKPDDGEHPFAALRGLSLDG